MLSSNLHDFSGLSFFFLLWAVVSWIILDFQAYFSDFVGLYIAVCTVRSHNFSRCHLEIVETKSGITVDVYKKFESRWKFQT